MGVILDYCKQALKILSPALHNRLRESWRKRRMVGPGVMSAFASAYPGAVIIQIGSNDGRKHDPLFHSLSRHNWRGVLVEPVPYVFARLKENHRHDQRLRLENVAVAPSNGRMPFYHLKEDIGNTSLPSWYDELGSFRLDIVLKHKDRIPDIEDRIQSIDVECLEFDTLCERNAIRRPDLIHIDTEGYDYEIIRHIDLNRFRPRLLIFEHKHLNDNEKEACEKLLFAAGYWMFVEGQDTWCLLDDPSSVQQRVLRTRCEKLLKKRKGYIRCI